MRKVLLTTEQINELLSLYNNGWGLEKISKYFKIGRKATESFLSENNISKRKVGNSSNEEIGKKIGIGYNELLPDDGFKYIASYKETDFQSNDYLNKAGALTNYLKLVKPEIIIPTNYAKKKYFLENNSYWHEQYFILSQIKLIKTKKCKYCEWETTDINNVAGTMVNHLKNNHNKTIEDLILDYPEEIKYFPTFVSKIDKISLFLIKENYTTCLVCNEKMKIITNSHLKKHNMTMTDYKFKFNNQVYSDKQKEKIINHYNKHLKFSDKTFKSKSENLIFNYIKSLGVKCEQTNKKLLNGSEIDILCPNDKIGIEFNGNQWHTELFGKKGYTTHLSKTKLANEKGYRLIQICEDEWLLNPDIVKSKLKHILKMNISEKIYGRKCTISRITRNIGNNFLNENHIQGATNSQIYYGAYYNEELISVMSFNSKRVMTSNAKNNDWELTRFASNINYTVIGLAGKFLKHFINKHNPLSIISFGDRRWSEHNENNMYVKLGFKFDGYTKPSYSYFNPKVNRIKRFHKFGFGKSALKRKGMYIDGMSEWECMQHHGWDKIWDCGLIRYVWKKCDKS